MARDVGATSREGFSYLASFLNLSRMNSKCPASGRNGGQGDKVKFQPIMAPGTENEDVNGQDASTDGATTNGATDVMEAAQCGVGNIVCGPLLNYRNMENKHWVGSVMVVLKGGGKERCYVPILTLRSIGPRKATDGHATANGDGDAHHISAICLYSDPRNTFWRFDLRVALAAFEMEWEYTLSDLNFDSRTKPRASRFFVPAVAESMRILFHTCNGFSVGTDEEAWSGPALWNDVMRRHQERPFHVMIGGGDQIYNDGIRVNGPLRPWADIVHPVKRKEFPFPESLRLDCDNYYLKNYIRWYGTEPFAAANGQIPQLQIWDDHDIIDGFGSYVHKFMECDVFRGIGGIAHKYYMLFQHHLPPPPSTYTTSNLETAGPDGRDIDAVHVKRTYVHPPMVEPSYIVGQKPGPYVAEPSQSIYTRLGARMAFLGLDARTERTRHQVNYPETYELVFSRVKEGLQRAKDSGVPIQHLIVLLGIPIAYPRLTWLENIFSSPLMGPIKFMNRRFGVAGGFINHFDGNVDLLDDLDDHYTAKTHKQERAYLITQLMNVAAQSSARVTILSGDVHLAALGRFYTKASVLKQDPIERDHRYIVNIISSAIVNKPPPQAVANLLARRNKVHHFNEEADETLIKMFDKDPGSEKKTASHNHVTMPSRNFAIITENSPNKPPQDLTPPRSQGYDSLQDGRAAQKIGAHESPAGQQTWGIKGELNAGTRHKAADPARHGRGSDGSLDVCFCVEMDQHDKMGQTESYGMTIPILDYQRP